MYILDAVKNFSKWTVSTWYDSSATSIVLSTWQWGNFPNPSTDGEFNFVWWNKTDFLDPSDDPYVEICRCTNRSSDTLTIERAQESTTSTDKNISWKTYEIALCVTSKVVNDIDTSLNSKSDLSLISQATNVIYVDNKRTDTYTEIGTYNLPFKTIQAAMDSITGNSSSNRFCIKIATGAVYTEALAINKDFVTLEGYWETILSGAITLTAPHFRLKNLKTTGVVNGTYTQAFLAEISDCSITTGKWTVSCSVSGAYVQISGGTTIWTSDIDLTGVTGVVSCQSGYFEGTHTFTNCYMEIIGFKNYNGTINLEAGTEVHIGTSLCIGTTVNLKTGATAYIDATSASGITLNNTGGTLVLTTSHRHISIPTYGTPDYTTLQQYINLGSAGRIDGGVLSDDGSGGVNYTAINGIIKATDSITGEMTFFKIAAGNIPSASLTDNALNYFYIDNDTTPGTPVVAVTSDRTSVNLNNQFIFGDAWKEGTIIETVSGAATLANFERNENERLAYRGVQHASGAIICSTGTRNLTSTDGVSYFGNTKITTTAKDTSASDKLTYYYRDGSGGWTKVINQTQIDNTQYDDGDGTLATLSAGRYGVHWVYICGEGDIYVVYGRGNYTLAQAQAAVVFTPPTYLSSFALLAAKVIVLKNSDTLTITSAYTTLFPQQSAGDHATLANLDYASSGHTGFAPLASPTFTGTVTLPKTTEIQDTSADHQYVLAVNELTADRTVTLPLLAGNDEFVFKDHAQTLTNKTLGTTQLGEVSLKLDETLSADEKWSGITTKGTAGATLAVGDVCYLASSGKWLLNDGILDGTDTGFSKQLGICVLAGADTEATEMLLYGKIRSAAFPTFTVGSPVYLDDTAGDLTATQPSTTNFAIRKVGYALTAEDLMFNPSNDFAVVK